MKIYKIITRVFAIALVAVALNPYQSKAQTDNDAIMMYKKNFCVGGIYGYSSWTNYWEGTLKRDNENLGRVSTQMASIMGNYGITSKLNVLFSVPYISTKASQGTLHGQHGLQDMSLWVKWMPYQKNIGKKGTLSLFAVGGVSFPVSNYTPDFLPVSIGLHSTTVTGRVMADYLRGSFFVTASGTFSYRNNINISRNSYYTTELHLTDEVEMPNTASFNFRTGYRGTHLIAEAVVQNMTTLGGFDIRRNDMPFPSNKMNATNAGVAFKYTFKNWRQLAVVGNASYTIAGRNVGQSTSFAGGVFYAFNTAKKEKTSKQ